MKTKSNFVLISLSAIILVFLVSTQTMKEKKSFSNPVIQIGMVVSDLSNAERFYQDVLGLTKTGGFSIDSNFAKTSGLTGGRSFDVTILKLENIESATQLKLMSFNQPAAHPKPAHIQDDTGVQYITLYITSMDKMISRLTEQNIPFLGETPTHLPDGRMFVLVQDPDGTFVELIGQN